MKRLLPLLLALALLLGGCSGEKSADASGPASLSFAEATSLDAIKALDGKTVSIVGYMATLSPISGEYMYLMNLPYQSCPFCVPNTTQLSNTMAVYAQKGKSFAYTDQAIRVTGVLEVADLTDDYGYTYNYRIKDASYAVVDLSTLSSDYALWYSIAEDGIVADLSAMFNYLYFVCQWTEYTVSYTAEDGSDVFYYLYPGDAENYLADDSANGYAKMHADTYFPGLIARVNAISATELTDLTDLLSDAKQLENYALGELSAKRYSYNEATDRYALDNAADLTAQFDALYARFSSWLTKWQL